MSEVDDVEIEETPALVAEFMATVKERGHGEVDELVRPGRCGQADRRELRTAE
jgi:hypothetical protein